MTESASSLSTRPLNTKMTQDSPNKEFA